MGWDLLVGPALQPWPRPLPALTLCALRTLRPGSCWTTVLLQESDTVAAVGVLAEALLRTLVDALCVSDGRPGKQDGGVSGPESLSPACGVPGNPSLA